MLISILFNFTYQLDFSLGSIATKFIPSLYFNPEFEMPGLLFEPGNNLQMWFHVKSKKEWR